MHMLKNIKEFRKTEIINWKHKDSFSVNARADVPKLLNKP